MLEHFFGSKTRLKLLQLFFRHPEKTFYVRELARLTDIQVHGVRRELANLERLSIIMVVAEGEVHNESTGTERSKYYRLNQDALLFPELKALLIKAKVLEEQELIGTIKEKGGKITLFLLTGVFSGDKDAATDILLVGVIKPAAIAKIITQYEDETGQEVRYTIMTEKEFMDRRELGDKFLYTVFEGKHLTVVNNYSSVH